MERFSENACYVDPESLFSQQFCKAGSGKVSLSAAGEHVARVAATLRGTCRGPRRAYPTLHSPAGPGGRRARPPHYLAGELQSPARQ